MGHASLLNAYEEQVSSPQIIILRGEEDNLAKWQQECAHGYAPHRLVFAITSNVEDLPVALAEKKYRKSSKDGVTAYICYGMQCDAPIEKFEELQNVLTSTSVQPLSH